jgi:hypothetical protein
MAASFNFGLLSQKRKSCMEKSETFLLLQHFVDLPFYQPTHIQKCKQLFEY